ncbi:hypothetical protein GALMADRAFT_140872 [Galerina marginata CBS 339.88]|uniref:RING-type domain-containing protein n=1 Tax=Galerina marginata (strain CBS 339.88) TaxID=685588 RepID=A0A067SWT7_GALM3|nr:hypothetical protein GALMADRAFT_140872 [Galerina marginata CBS 339.88]
MLTVTSVSIRQATSLAMAMLKDRVVIDLTEEETRDTFYQIVETDLSILNEMLSCPICKERLKRPMILTECGHAFCRNCILGWLNHCFQTRRGGFPDPRSNITTLRIARFTCPTCRISIARKPVKDYTLDNLTRLIEDLILKYEGKAHISVEGVNEDAVWVKFFPI